MQTAIDTPLFQTRAGKVTFFLVGWSVLPDGSVTVVLQSPDGHRLARRGRDLIPVTKGARDVLSLGDELHNTVIWRWALNGHVRSRVAEA